MTSKYETYNSLKRSFEELETLDDLKEFSLVRVDRLYGEEDGDELRFWINDHQYLKMYHHQECCESVTIKDICGDLNDLVHSPILIAEERENDFREIEDGDQRWTFYHIATIKGSVDISWYGESNGYYSTSVDTYYVDTQREGM